MNLQEYPADWQSKTIEYLEDEDWGLADDASHLIATCHQLRKKQISLFSIEDIRIMIGQGIGLPYLIPIALEKLKDDILAEGDFYPGDLLKAVLETNSTFWKDAPDFYKGITQITKDQSDKIQNIEPDFKALVSTFTSEVESLF